MAEGDQTPIEQRIPLVAQVKQDLRGEDLAEWGKDINEWVASNRTVRKEHAALRAEYEKLKAEPRIKPLGADSKPEDVAAFRKAFGVPDKPEGYIFKLPEGMPDDVIDPEEQKAFAALMHKHNLPQSVMQDIMAFEVANVAAARKFIADEENGKAKILAEKLTAEYGAQAQVKVDGALKFIEAFGGTELRKRVEDKEHPDPIGNDPAWMDLFIKAGALVSERGLMPGGTGVGAGAGEEPDYRKIYPKSFADGHMH